VVFVPPRLGIDSLAMFGRYNYANAEDGLAEHSHAAALEICYLVRGRQTYCIGKHSYHLRGGDVFLTMPDERHGTGGGPQEKGLLYWMILLNPSSTGGSLLGLAQKESLDQLKNPAIFSGGTEALARSCGRTSQHVNACLQRFHGITATEAVNAARMEFAARELRTGTKKILEICFDCGFENLAHFYRIFKAATGTTPRAYRQNHQLLIR